MTPQVLPHALARQRRMRGMSVEQLAAAVGVTARAVRYWETGQRVVGDRAFGRLLTALRCDAQALTGLPRGTESLSDLRRAAGMSAEQTASFLRQYRPTRSFNVTVEQVRDLERGRKVGGRRWKDPVTYGQIVRALAKCYRVPERLVIDAWRRTRPEGPAPKLPVPNRREPSPQLIADWEALNPRQRTYLACILQQDQEAEVDEQRRRAEGGEHRRASEWRRLPLALYAPVSAVGHTRIQERLRSEGVHDPGVGPSIAALERRGLITAHRDHVYIQGLGDVPRTRVELTRRGRAAARAGLGVERRTAPPAPLLSAWLWSVLVRVIRERDQGVDGLAGRSPHHLAVGHSPDGRVPSRGFIVLRQPDGATSGPHLWFPTASGIKHAVDHLAMYRTLHPDVDTTGMDHLIE